MTLSKLSSILGRELIDELKRRIAVRIEKLSSLNSQLEDKVKMLNQFLTSQRVANLTELGDKIKKIEAEKDSRPNISLTNWNNDYSKRPTQDYFNKEVQAKVKVESDLLKEQNKVKQLEKEKVQLEQDKTQLTTDLTDKNKEITTILTKWKAKDLTELSTSIQDTLGENKVLMITVLPQKNRQIQNLQLKNEKLTDSYKKLINYFAEARLAISHLQKDLQTEKQDKIHIQKELNDTLVILNKPTAEMGTQTDLTAEQITQMEQELESKRRILGKYEFKLEELRQKDLNITKKIKEIKKKVVQFEIENLTPSTFDEEELINNIKKMLKEPFKDWTQVGVNLNYYVEQEPYISIKSLLINQAELARKKAEIERSIESEEKRNKDIEELINNLHSQISFKESLIKDFNSYKKIVKNPPQRKLEKMKEGVDLIWITYLESYLLGGEKVKKRFDDWKKQYSYSVNEQLLKEPYYKELTEDDCIYDLTILKKIVKRETSYLLEERSDLEEGERVILFLHRDKIKKFSQKAEKIFSNFPENVILSKNVSLVYEKEFTRRDDFGNWHNDWKEVWYYVKNKE